MPRNVIIFGAGLGGQRVAKVLPPGDRLLAFTDNDQKKHDTLLFGKPVVAPNRILDSALAFDTVIVGSQYVREICSQLLEMGVSKDRIELVEADVLGGAYEFDTRGFTRKIAVATVLLTVVAAVIYVLV